MSVTPSESSIPSRGRPVAESLGLFDAMPESAYVRLPVVCALFGCSPATVWRRVKTGGIPTPYTLSAGMTAWRVGELRGALNNIAKAA